MWKGMKIIMKKMNDIEIKSEMMRILKYIDYIAKKNNIKYTLIGGSLIGAIRGNGIIPWDDDIDIGLMYSDYQKLMKAIENDSNSEFRLIRFENNKSCYFPHTKLVSTRTYLVEKNLQEVDNMGVFVDIFVYFYLPYENKKRKRAFNNLIITNKLIYSLRKPNKNEKKYAIKYIRYIICKYIIGRERLYKYLRNIYVKYDKSDYIVSSFPQYGIEREIQDSNCFNEFQTHLFEKEKIMITKEYDKMLTKTFGNYMELPPECDRINHQLSAYWRNNEKK